MSDETKLICPNCGTEMKLPKTSRLVTGVTLSKETGGIHVLEAEKIKNNNNKEGEKNMNERKEALKKAGVDTSKYFQVALPGGDTVTMTYGENGVPVIVTEAETDPILEQIIEDGYVKNTKLHRRWVMSQMFKMLNYKSDTYDKAGYDGYLSKNYGYMYQFDMMLEEVRVLSKLEARDVEAFEERSHFFTKEVVVATCRDYLNKLEQYIDTLEVKKCKGISYVRIKGKNIFVEDLPKKIYMPMERKIAIMEQCETYLKLYIELRRFTDSMISIPRNTKKCRAWVDAFKGSGSFYTLKNLIMYHNCYLYNDLYKLSRDSSMQLLTDCLDKYAGNGWRYMAMLKKCIADNHFDFSATMKEIHK